MNLEKPKSTVRKYVFDHYHVPVVIQYVAAENNRKLNEMVETVADVHFFNTENVILTERPYRKKLSQQAAEKIARKERGIPDSYAVQLLFVGHPNKFFSWVAQAYVDAYRMVDKKRVREVERVLDLISPFDPRRGYAYDEWNYQ